MSFFSPNAAGAAIAITLLLIWAVEMATLEDLRHQRKLHEAQFQKKKRHLTFFVLLALFASFSALMVLSDVANQT